MKQHICMYIVVKHSFIIYSVFYIETNDTNNSTFFTSVWNWSGLWMHEYNINMKPVQRFIYRFSTFCSFFNSLYSMTIVVFLTPLCYSSIVQSGVYCIPSLFSHHSICIQFFSIHPVSVDAQQKIWRTKLSFLCKLRM